MNLYLQVNELGYYPYDGVFTALEGADKIGGYNIIHFDNIDEVPYGSMVVSGIEETVSYFNRIGIVAPKNLVIFDQLYSAGYLKRKVRYTTLVEFYNSNTTFPIFIKPRFEYKAVPSGVLKTSTGVRDTLTEFLQDHAQTELIVCDPVEILSEYRVFVTKRKGIISMHYYLGDPFVYPDAAYIKEVCNYILSLPNIPASFVVDFMVTPTGTDVIELNDAWAIGSYGMDSKDYFNFLLVRWRELMATVK